MLLCRLSTLRKAHVAVSNLGFKGHLIGARLRLTRKDNQSSVDRVCLRRRSAAVRSECDQRPYISRCTPMHCLCDAYLGTPYPSN